MYGYVKAHAPEMKVREQTYYRAVYCGLCRAMGRCTGQCSRLTLSYDFTFLALLRLALTAKEVAIHPRRCVLHPFKKRPMAEPDETLAYCAYASAVMAYHKIKDDKADEQGIRRAKAFLATPYVRLVRRRALKAGFAALDQEISLAMEKISEIEIKRVPSVDQPANLFGDLMAQVVSYGLSGDAARIGRSLGYHLGRWIYLIDAADDYEEDKSRGRYNPFACLWQNGEMTDIRREDLSKALLSELADMEAALDLCYPDHPQGSNLWGTVHNILYMGMPLQAKKILYPEKGSETADVAVNHEK